MSETSDPLTTYSYTRDQSLENVIVTTLSNEPVDIDPDAYGPLYEWIDIEALERLIDSTRCDVRVSTVVWDQHVVITPGTVEVYDDPVCPVQ